jgi:ketose-bisphosphate aldolase
MPVRKNTAELVRNALAARTVIPAFNIPYLPMMVPVVRALRDTDSVGLIAVARLEWEKFESKSLEAVRERYEEVKDERFTRLHLDHVPVIDEDDRPVDYLEILERALELGYESVMVDGSRLPLEENIRATRRVVEAARVRGVPVEAELGAVFGHESGPMPPYEELFRSGRGFTDVEEARRFVEATGVDWLSVAIGNVHGAISAARKEKKIAARLHIDRLEALRRATGIPLVLHGGTGIRKRYLLEAFRHGIAKINVATAIRQPYERLRDIDPDQACEAVYETTCALLRDELEIAGNAAVLTPLA